MGGEGRLTPSPHRTFGSGHGISIKYFLVNHKPRGDFINLTRGVQQGAPRMRVRTSTNDRMGILCMGSSTPQRAGVDRHATDLPAYLIIFKQGTQRGLKHGWEQFIKLKAHFGGMIFQKYETRKERINEY